MDFFMLIAAFGGGLIGAYMGGLPVFILTGIAAIVSSSIAMAGIADVTAGFVTFGAYLGPHTTFVGGVAAAAYAGKIKKLNHGSNIIDSLYGLGDPMVLIVGGLFGVLGYIVNYVAIAFLHLNTDTVAFTVFITAIITRLMFGSTGLISPIVDTDKRPLISDKKNLAQELTLGVGLGAVVVFTYMSMLNAGASEVALAQYPILCFGIAVTSFIFMQTGFATPATQYIVYPTAMAMVITNDPVIGMVTSIGTVLFADFFGKLCNTNTDTHFDPPGTTIFLSIWLLNMLFGSGLFTV